MVLLMVLYYSIGSYWEHMMESNAQLPRDWAGHEKPNDLMHISDHVEQY